MSKTKKKNDFDEGSLLKWLWEVASEPGPNHTYSDCCAAAMCIRAHLITVKQSAALGSKDFNKANDDIQRVNKIMGALAVDEECPVAIRLQAAKVVLA